MECGTTANACNGKTGMYALDYTIPDAGYVQYRYGSGNWSDIEGGVRFENVLNPGIPGQSVGVRYNVGLYVEVDRWEKVFSCPGVFQSQAWICATFNNMVGKINDYRVVADPVPSFACNAVQGSFSGVKFTLVTDSGTFNNSPQFCAYRTSQPTSIATCANSQVGSTSFLYFRNLKPIRAIIVRADGQPENTQSSCTFKVFDASA
jgi:hypothetical protein